MITRADAVEQIDEGSPAPTWRVELGAVPSPEWRRRFLEAALGENTIFGNGLRLQGSSLLFPLEPGELRAGLRRIDSVIAEVNAEINAGTGDPGDPPSDPHATILVVDDQPEVCAITSDILRDHGYGVISTADAHRALRMATTAPIQLLVTDVVMPAMDGRELAERILGAQPGMKVLFMSAYAVQGKIIPGAPLIQKPFTPDGLLRAVHAVLTVRPSPFRRRPV